MWRVYNPAPRQKAAPRNQIMFCELIDHPKLGGGMTQLLYLADGDGPWAPEPAADDGLSVPTPLSSRRAICQHSWRGGAGTAVARRGEPTRNAGGKFSRRWDAAIVARRVAPAVEGPAPGRPGRGRGESSPDGAPR